MPNINDSELTVMDSGDGVNIVIKNSEFEIIQYDNYDMANRYIGVIQGEGRFIVKDKDWHITRHDIILMAIPIVALLAVYVTIRLMGYRILLGRNV